MTMKRDQQRNAAERFLVGVLRSRDDELAALARSRFGADTPVDVEHLTRVKAIVEALLPTFTSTTEADARRAARALEALREPAHAPEQAAPATPREAEEREPAPVVARHGVPYARSGESGERSPWAAGAAQGDAARVGPQVPPKVSFVEPNASLGRTLDAASPGAPPAVAPLPFKASPGFTPAPVPPSLEHHPQMGSTAALDSSRTSGPVLPFSAPKGNAPATPESLDAYARFCAECAIYPEALPQVRQRWGVADELSHMRLDDRWRKHLATAPDARQTWEKLVAQYRAAARQR